LPVFAATRRPRHATCADGLAAAAALATTAKHDPWPSVE
jgi:hypothetical protein